MGVPKFFRWISERYPKIIERYGSPPTERTCQEHFGQSPPDYLPPPDPLSECGLPPVIDRMYLDMNGIIHCCSHNNSESEENPDAEGEVTISDEEIFRNISYYLDRLVKDMAQPRELLYLAIDGVAPRAKLNQQRARRYRSGKEGEIEQTVYDAHIKAMEREQEENRRMQEGIWNQGDEIQEDTGTAVRNEDSFDPAYEENVKEVQPGRFSGKFETMEEGGVSTTDFGEDERFHSNAITPGTAFFQRCTQYLEEWIGEKVKTDPDWQHLTIIFSGPNVPGEGEHKIMQFMREQQARANYDPNLRHCIVGQDGDLIMLSLATHEPNLVLLREQVMFGKRSLKHEVLSRMYGLETYIHNSRFEFIHMNVLRDYLAFEFETSNVIPGSKFDLEHTIDDFVFMTFFVGNDFLPHLPAIDIADSAFDLLFHTYRALRKKWLRAHKKRRDLLPYLTNGGQIISGRRLEEFLTVLGSHELQYYDFKKTNEDLDELRRLESKYGDSITPSDDVIRSKENSDRARFREMIQSQFEKEDVENLRGKEFEPVLSGSLKSHRQKSIDSEDDDEEDDRSGLFSQMGSLLRFQVGTGGADEMPVKIDDQDIKGRYYHDKFGFSPFDAEKHVALRKAYIEGLVWNLKYYYEGCVSWEWYYPYHYGPMLSDLVGLEEILETVSFNGKLGKPLKPFEQLMACMPPSHADLLPEKYRPLMTEPNSPIAHFYPTSFVIDMNGKRWPWEAVVLLPFINSEQLLAASNTVELSSLSEAEQRRNKEGEALVFKGTPNNSVEQIQYGDSAWQYRGTKAPKFLPKLRKGVQTPLDGLPTLRDGLVQSVWRKMASINVHGSPSRYSTSILELKDMAPEIISAEAVAKHLIGSTIYINYPHLVEAFVTAVLDQKSVFRGNDQERPWTGREAQERKEQASRLVRQYFSGNTLPGSGGLIVGSEDNMRARQMMLRVRPVTKLEKLSNGSVAKAFAKFEVEVPMFVTAWFPVEEDKRLVDVPLRLEKNPYRPQKLLVHGRDLPSPNYKNKKGSNTFSYRMRTPSFTLSARTIHSGLPLRKIDAVPILPRTRRLNATFTKPRVPSLRGAAFSIGIVAAVSFLTGATASLLGGAPVGPHLGFFPFQRSSSPENDSSELANTFGLGTDLEHPGLRKTPSLEFEHGTTTLSFVFQGGIIAAVDSRASLGSFVGSGTVQKVLPINSHMIGTMAGGAADCSFWIRQLSQHASFHELTYGTRISVARASRLLSNALYENRNAGLSVGTMIMGFSDQDDEVPPEIYHVDSSGLRMKGDMFAVGSGSTYALGIIDSGHSFDMTEEQAVALGIEAIRRATYRDAYSGGIINVYLITRRDGWKRVYREDLAQCSGEN